MTDYTGLVKALRYCTSSNPDDCDICAYQPFCQRNGTGRERIMIDAAAAIEALQAEVERLEPKRGEWVDGDNFEDPFLGKFRCSVCGHAVQAIEYNPEQKTVRFASGKTKYCPNCGAKMEVQDDKA